MFRYRDMITTIKQNKKKKYLNCRILPHCRIRVRESQFYPQVGDSCVSLYTFRSLATARPSWDLTALCNRMDVIGALSENAGQRSNQGQSLIKVASEKP